MSGADFTLEGTENLKRMFSEFPEFGYRRAMMRSFRKAAAPFRRAIKANLPSYLKGLNRAIKMKGGRDKKNPSLYAGIFSGVGVYVNRKGVKWDPWQIAYWHNYGTMANRDPGHRFARTRSKKSINRKGGLKPLRFVERAWDQSQGQVEKAFNETADKEMMKFFEERAAK